MPDLCSTDCATEFTEKQFIKLIGCPSALFSFTSCLSAFTHACAPSGFIYLLNNKRLEYMLLLDCNIRCGQ